MKRWKIIYRAAGRRLSTTLVADDRKAAVATFRHHYSTRVEIIDVQAL